MLYLSQLLGKYTFKCNTSRTTKPTNIPDFYWQIVQSWFELKTLTNETKDAFDIRRESLWLNKHIKINKQEVNWKMWYNKKIFLIHDLVNSEG